MSQRAGLEEEPPRKIRRVVPEMVGNIIDITHEEDPDAPILVKITPGLDPYLQLDIVRRLNWNTRLAMNLPLKLTRTTHLQMTFHASPWTA